MKCGTVRYRAVPCGTAAVPCGTVQARRDHFFSESIPKFSFSRPFPQRNSLQGPWGRWHNAPVSRSRIEHQFHDGGDTAALRLFLLLRIGARHRRRPAWQFGDDILRKLYRRGPPWRSRRRRGSPAPSDRARARERRRGGHSEKRGSMQSCSAQKMQKNAVSYDCVSNEKKYGAMKIRH